MIPKFSIIIVAYKRYEQIKCLMYSLLSQSFQDFEVIVIHDGEDWRHSYIISEILYKFKGRLKYLQTPIRYNDWGMSLRNIGIPLTNGQFIINTNDDNYYTPNWLAELSNAIDNNPECNFVYYDMILSHNNIESENHTDYGLFKPQIRHSYIDVGQFAVKREIIVNRRFNLVAPADGELIEEIKTELVPVYINKVLFVHN